MIYSCTKFTGHYPVGVSAIVAAPSASIAAQKLNEELKTQGLLGDALPASMEPFNDGTLKVRILQDGDY